VGAEGLGPGSPAAAAAAEEKKSQHPRPDHANCCILCADVENVFNTMRSVLFCFC
jgi:hypothetical protein